MRQFLKVVAWLIISYFIAALISSYVSQFTGIRDVTTISYVFVITWFIVVLIPWFLPEKKPKPDNPFER